jgi:signal transduction histidine kinase
MRKYFLGFLFIFFISHAAISDPLIIGQYIKKDTVDLLPYLKYLASTNEDSINAFQNQNAKSFTMLDDRVFLNNKYHYFTFSFTIEDPTPEDLVFQFAKLDYVRLRLHSEGLPDRTFHTGELVPYINKSIPHNRDGFEEIRVVVEPGDYTCLLVMSDRKHRSPLVKANIMSFENWKNVLHDNLSHTDIAQGIFHGVLWSMILYFVYYFFITFDKSGSRFVLSAISMSLFMLIAHGFIPPLFPSANPAFLVAVNHLILIAAIFAFISFIGFFSETDQNYPVVNKVVRVSKAIILLLYIISLLPLFSRQYIQHYYFSRTIVDACTILLWSGHTLYIFFRTKAHKLIVYTSLIAITGMLITLIKFISTPEEPAIYLPLQVGYVVALITISFVIVEKYRLLLFNKTQMQSQLIEEMRKNEELQKDQNEKLEREVQRRTEEIFAQNEELVQQQEELAAQRDTLENQSRTIEQKNNELLNNNLHLEENVQLRTQQLEQINTELVKQNQQLEQFSYILAHNLRSPVARLVGLTHLFEITDGDDRNEIIERISGSALDLSDVLKDVNTMLEVKSGEGPVKSQVSVKQLVNKCVGRFQEQIDALGIEIVTEIELDGIVTIHAYLESIILNLFSNAIKYRKSQGDHRIYISSKKNDNKMEFVIEDNGVGIDLKENQSKLFGMYQRFHDHVEGKGLGLYLVKAQVDTLHGEISIISELNKGTRFTINIPLSA